MTGNLGNKTIKARYEELAVLREPYLRRARICASYTLPMLIPPEGSNRHSRFKTPYQSVGAEGVNNLTAKQLMALFPPNTPIFKYTLESATLEEFSQDGNIRSRIEETLNKIERKVTYEIEVRAIRAPAHEALLHANVAGNVLLYIPQEGGMRSFPLSKYVVKRSPMGKLQEIIVQELIPFKSLPDNIKTIAFPYGYSGESQEDVEVYTYCHFKHKKCFITQEINGNEIEESKVEHPQEGCPFIPIREYCVDGEDYGRSFVEMWLGDLRALEKLSRAIAEGAAVSAKVIFMVNPNGSTRVKDLAEAENGGFVAGSANEVTTLQAQKYADMRVAIEQARAIEERLRKAFLMTSSIQRNGERVTATEWQLLAQELETSQGGAYSLMSQEVQLPLIKRFLYILEKTKDIPKLPSNIAKPTIVAGMEALGRGNDLNKLRTFLGTLTETIGPQQVAQWVNVSDIISRVGISIGVDMAGLIKTPEQVQQEQQQAQQMAMLQQAMPNGISQIGQMIQNAQKGEQQSNGEQ